MPSNDRQLAAIIEGTPVTNIHEVIDVMHRLDAALAPDDGVKWFNFLYMKVTEGVLNGPPAVGWEDPLWLERLDVIFAQLYFTAVAANARGIGNVAVAWRPLFSGRYRRDLYRIQFALAGMNAHINHDLPIALVEVCSQWGIRPSRNSPQYRDFDRVNSVLERVEREVKDFLLDEIPGIGDHGLHNVDDVIAIWSVKAARETAWRNGQLLWNFRGVPSVRDHILRSFGEAFHEVGRFLMSPTK